MKQWHKRRGKTHVIESDWPIPAGGTYKTACERFLTYTEFAIIGSDDLRDKGVREFVTCVPCQRSTSQGKKFEYSAMQGTDDDNCLDETNDCR